jgi:hypothetical protein
MIIAITLMFLWYFYWVLPHDGALYNIMDCMGEQTTQEAYEQCAKELK